MKISRGDSPGSIPIASHLKDPEIFLYVPMSITAELQWLEHLRNHENMFETGVVRANEC